MKCTNPLHAFIAARTWKRLLYFFFFFEIITLTGCFNHFYKTNTAETTDSERLQRLVNEKKYFILHTGNQYFSVDNIRVENDQLNGEIDNLPPLHQKYLHPKDTINNRYQSPYKDIVKLEVHLYTNDSIKNTKHISLPVKDFYRMDVYDTDKKSTRDARIMSIIGITVGAAAIAVVIASAGKNDGAVNSGTANYVSGGCSPQLYSFDGEMKALTGILFSGSVFAPLQRTDYVPLKAPSPANEYHLQIKSGENEYLYIKQAKLLQVQHKSTDKILVDRHGQVLVYSNPIFPEIARTREKKDVKKDLSIIDGKYCAFTNALPGQQASSLVLDFKKPVNAVSGKLIINARNTAWALYVFKKYKSLYGENYASLSAIKDNGDPQKLMQCELDQSLPLLVSVKKDGGWKPVDYFLTPGNLAARDMIMEIDLADYKDSGQIQLKLETAYMFWEIDYAAMDFSEHNAISTADIIPYNLVKAGRTEQLPDPAQQDITLNDKEALNIDFLLKKNMPGMVSSCFFVGRGYYHDNTYYEGKPDAATLASFAQKGGFDKYSRQVFEALQSACTKSNAAAKDLSAKN